MIIICELSNCGYVLFMAESDKECIAYVKNNPFILSRMYALRKIRHEFKENKTLTDEEKVRQCYTKGLETLSMIKKQVVLGDLYSTRPLIIETKSKLNTTQ